MNDEDLEPSLAQWVETPSGATSMIQNESILRKKRRSGRTPTGWLRRRACSPLPPFVQPARLTSRRCLGCRLISTLNGGATGGEAGRHAHACCIASQRRDARLFRLAASRCLASGSVSRRTLAPTNMQVRAGRDGCEPLPLLHEARHVQGSAVAAHCSALTQHNTTVSALTFRRAERVGRDDG